jgi:hypothetical protein
MEQKRVPHIALAAILCIFVVLAVVFVLPLVLESPAAVLVVESGTVEVAQMGANMVQGQFSQVSGRLAIDQGSVIRTGQGRASVILYGSTAIRLAENTIVTLSSIQNTKDGRTVSLWQPSGTTWSRIVSVSGISAFEIETPHSVATAKGTAFETSVSGSATSTSLVEGNLHVQAKGTDRELDIEQNQAIDISEGNAEVRFVRESGFMQENMQKDEQHLQDLKEKIKSKYGVYIGIAKAQYGLTDEQVDRYIDDALRGKYSQQDIDDALDQFGVEIKI